MGISINSISTLRRAIRLGPYAWPGGYAFGYICDDGQILCRKCVMANLKPIIFAVAHNLRDGWRITGLDTIQSFEAEDELCIHCSTPLGDL